MASKRKSDGDSKAGSKKVKKNVGVLGVPAATRGFRTGFGSATGELKAYDITPFKFDVKVNPGGTEMPILMLPAQGADFTNRIGRKTTTTKLYIRGMIGVKRVMETADPSTWGRAQLLRMIVFVDWQPNGARPLGSDLLVANGDGEISSESQINLNNRQRFKILKDKVWAFDPVTTSDTFNRTVAPIKVFKKVQVETIYGTSTPAVADIQSGAIYCLFVGSEDGTTGRGIGQARITCRARFIDN